MNTLQITKSPALNGRVKLSGAKNSALRLLAASLLTTGRVRIENYPAQLLDAEIHVEMLQVLGKRIVVSKTESSIVIDEDVCINSTLSWDGRSIRNTLLILGALLSRTGAGKVPLPGGCDLGDRKFDIHIYVLERLGARVWQEGRFLCAEVEGGRLKGADIHLRIRSTGATENAIICGVLAAGRTQIWNPHIRPEIIDLIKFLKKMGANINVYGQERIEIFGVDSLGSVNHTVIVDNMEAVTWLVAASITRGEVEIVDFPHEDLTVVTAHLESAGAKLYRSNDSTIVKGGSCYPIEISTGPHPGINSDVQPILAAWAVAANGESRIIDLRFPGRYEYANQMERMGLKSIVEGDMLKIFGCGGHVKGASVTALDLRAGAALALCGLIADGETNISDAWQISRGYVHFVDKLSGLGANIKWLD